MGDEGDGDVIVIGVACVSVGKGGLNLCPAQAHLRHPFIAASDVARIPSRQQ